MRRPLDTKIFQSLARSDKPDHSHWMVIFPILGIAAFVLAFISWQNYTSVDKTTRELLTAKVQLVDEHVGQLLRNINHTLEQISRQTSNANPCSQPLLAQLARSNPEYRAISVIDRHGINRCSSLEALTGLDRSVEEYVQRAIAQPKTRSMVIEAPIKSKLSGTPILPIHRTITGPDGQFSYLVQVSIDLEYFDQLLAALKGDLDHLTLIHDSGVILARAPDPVKFRLRSLANSQSAFDAHLASGAHLSTHKLTSPIDGAERFFVVTHIANKRLSFAPQGRLLTSAGTSTQQAYAVWYRQTAWLAATWLLLAISLVTLARRHQMKEKEQHDRLERRNRTIEQLDAANLCFRQEQDARDHHAIVSETDRHGTITYANTTFCEVSGYEAHELLGQNHRLLNSGTHAPEFFQNMWRTISAGRPWHGLVCNRAKDGHLYWVNSTIVPIRNNQGQIDKYISLRTEVTELVAAQAALRQSQQELIAAKEEAEQQRELAQSANHKKSEFLAGMSHELRTPMNSILGFSQILQMENLSPENLDCVQHIHRAGQHLLRLINEVLDLSRIETGKLELQLGAIPLAEALREAVTIIEPQAQRNNIRLELLPPSTELHILADVLRLQQVLLNLISNAIKYNRPHGRVQISVQEQGHRVRILVQDTGIGLSPQSLQQLFTPYSRFGPKGVEGTGIGLTITKRLVEAMNGTIGVSSEAHVGSLFWLEFDQLKIQSGGTAAEIRETLSDAQELPEPLAGKVLYIEDDHANQAVVARALRGYAGLNLQMTVNPIIGLRIAAKLKPDLILLDINLPEIDGYTVFKTLRDDSATRHIPVIGLSANAMPWDIEKAKALGFDEYLTKPLNVFVLRRMVRLYLQRKAA